MQANQIPAKFPIPFASSAGGAYTRSVPTASQIGVTPGAASLTDGFPPLTFIPTTSGGVAPSGMDMNGILFQTTAWVRWFTMGGAVPYDPTFQTAIGGYPIGCVIESAANPGIYWRSTVDNNTTDPDAGGAGWVLSQRIQAAGALTLYVSPGGNDSYNGLSPSTACQTIQGAINVAAANYDLRNSIVTINLTAGTYAGCVLLGYNIGCPVVLQGNNANPSSVVISAPGGVCCAVGQYAIMEIDGITLTATGGSAADYAVSGVGIAADNGATVTIGQDVVFGACGLTHIYASRGAAVTTKSPEAGFAYGYTINGSAPCHVSATSCATVTIVDATITLTGAPNFSTAFVDITGGAILNCWGDTFTGTATGIKWEVSGPSLIQTLGAGTSYLPGSSTWSGASVAVTAGLYA